MKKQYLTLAFFLLLSKLLSAQFSISISPQFTQVLGELKEDDYRPGIGLNLDVMYGEFGTKIPLVFQFGGQLDFNHHGSESESIQLATGEEASIRLRNQHVGLMGSLRLLSPYAPFRVYTEGLIGGRYFFSQDVFSVADADDPDIQRVAGKLTASFGGAIGALIRLTENLSLDIKGRYTQGSWAEYVDLETVVQSNNEVFYDFQRSETKMLMFMIGLNIWVTE